MDGFVRVARLPDLSPGRMLAVRVEEEDVVLYNVDGTLHATRDFCPHAGYPLSKSDFRGRYVKCALHGWEFDVASGRYVANPHICLRRYAVRVEGQDVWVARVPMPAAPPPPPPSLSRDDA